MDDLDKKILQILQKNGKTQYYKIAKELNLSASTVHYRVKKLIDNGIIEKISAVIDPEKIGYETTALIGLSVDPKKMDDIARKLALYDEVQVVATSSGNHDLIVQIIQKNEKELWRFINNSLKTIDGIEKNIHVSSFLDVYKRNLTIKIKKY